MEEYGEDWHNKPNDMLMWLMSEAEGVERSLEGVARRLLNYRSDKPNFFVGFRTEVSIACMKRNDTKPAEQASFHNIGHEG
ncbi:hypothetical protein BGY98DRAFT_549254 [Russula aff. rugulosa BPL654]|nr:hypothetical protein BGY98DRAFT_549254 [Russula aff. rugulosa BPL654]